MTFDCPHSWRSPSRYNRLRLKLSSDQKECRGLLCQLDIWTHDWLRSSAIDGIMHKSLDDSYGVRNIRPCRDHHVHKRAYYWCIQYQLHIFPLRTECRAVSLKEPKVNGERGRSRFGRLHVEAFQDTFDVVGLRQEKLTFIAKPTNLHTKYVSCRTEVLHGKLQPQFSNEFMVVTYVAYRTRTIRMLRIL